MADEPRIPKADRVYRLMAANLWHLLMDGHIPDTKYVRREIYRLCRKGHISFKDL